MNCSECEQLFDAYLDGYLMGSLRLEFDAHRLRCQRCQQTLAMLEAVGHVIASDQQAPELSDDFTERVMGQIERPRARLLPFPGPRVAIVAGIIVQAAAVLTFAVVWSSWPEQSTPVSGTPVAVVEPSGDPERDAIVTAITTAVEDRLWDLHAAGRDLTTDLASVAQLLNITLPADVAHESVKMAGANPWQAFWDMAMPGEEEEAESPPPVDDIHSI